MLILSGFVLAFAIEVRYVGWVLFYALILEAIYKIAVKYFRHKQHKVDWNFIKHEIWIISSALAFYGIFYLLFPHFRTSFLYFLFHFILILFYFIFYFLDS